MENIRTTTLAQLIRYEAAPTHPGCDEARFHQPIVIATTQGEWQFRYNADRWLVDGLTLVVGNAGDVYACRHTRPFANKGLAVCLKDGAVEAELTLFDKRVIDAGVLPRLFARAVEASSDDEFDSLVFTIFSEASSLSAGSNDHAFRLRIERAKRYLEQHAFEPVMLADLANQLGLSPYTTIRQFKAATGKTPHSYMLDFRLDAAKQMLLQTHASVEHVAKSVGFEDLAYFSRFFKRRTGHSPSRFRAA